MHLILIAWRSLLRDARSGELKLLFFAVVLAVTAMSSVSFLADRLERGLERDAGKLLGGDVVVASDQATPEAFLAWAHEAGLKSAQTITFPTMARAPQALGSNSKLVALKAVSSTYPLMGRIQLSTTLHPENDPQDTHSPKSQDAPSGNPPKGQAWVDAQVLESLKLNIEDPLILGDLSLKISGVIENEPDRGAGFMNFAPRVMINTEDLEGTHLIQPASRINWRLAVTGPTPSVKGFQDRVTEHITSAKLRGVRIETLKQGRPEMRITLERASEFLHLVALLCAMLCAVAVALAARSFAQKRTDECAMYRVLGQSQRSIEMGFLFEFLCVGLLASGLGALLGYSIHLGLIQLLSGLLNTDLPEPSLRPVIEGVGLGATLLLAFGWPPIMQLAKVPALRVIRRDLGPQKKSSLGVLAAGLLGFSALLISYSENIKLGLMVVGGFFAALLCFALITYGVLQLIRRFIEVNTLPLALNLAFKQMCARPIYSIIQVSALSVGLLAITLLILIRTDLISSWQESSPVNAPNRFVINIMPEQGEDFKRDLERLGVSQLDWYPMIRGRLVQINDRAITSNDFSDEQAKRMVDREFNLSYSTELPEHNRLVSGTWTPEDSNALSIEQNIAKTLGLQLGDRLKFDIAGVSKEARITSIRQLNWTSMRANFFVMYPVSQMENFPSTYIAAFKAPAARGFDNEILKHFPNVTNVDMSSTLLQIQSVLSQVIGAIQGRFVFTLAAGMVVLFAAITLTRQERMRDHAVMRALGADQTLLVKVQRTELLSIGAIAGLMSSLVALALGFALVKYVFDFAWLMHPLLVPEATLMGALIAWICGNWGLRGVLTRPVIETLRQS
jgi:putative ABC transport system permease protein